MLLGVLRASLTKAGEAGSSARSKGCGRAASIGQSCYSLSRRAREALKRQCFDLMAKWQVNACIASRLAGHSFQ